MPELLPNGDGELAIEKVEGLGHDALKRSIGLYGREVIPRVREALDTRVDG